MPFIDSLALYTVSQKAVAYGFMASGIFLLATAAFVYFLVPIHNSLWQGFKYGSLLFGVATLLGGIAYLNFSNKIYMQIESEYQSNAEQTLLAEAKRMSKVVSDYTVYKIVFASIVLISLLVILFLKPFWSGFAFPAALLFLVVMLIEAHSKYSIDAHWQNIKELSQSQSKESDL